MIKHGLHVGSPVEILTYNIDSPNRIGLVTAVDGNKVCVNTYLCNINGTKYGWWNVSDLVKRNII